MDLQSFLDTLIAKGTLVVARRVPRAQPQNGNPFTIHHTCYQSHADAAQAIAQMAAGPHDVYFALASYQQGFHPNPKTGKKQLRVRDNVAELKALWFDIDFKGDYPDIETALRALHAFEQATGLPFPSIVVSSGHGLHVYWPLVEAVTAERWQRLADALKAAAKAYGLAVDLVCTADACRILRPPGTINHKDPDSLEPVTLRFTNGKTFAYSELESVLTPWLETRRPVVGANSDLTGGVGTTEFPPARFDEVIKHCGVMQHVVETHGKKSSEPEWKDTLQLLKHCEDGAMWVHPVSDGHPGYSPAATDSKWQQRLENSAGPAKCSTFADHRPAICAKCPHNGFIKSPVLLGAAETQSIDGLPVGWRVGENYNGVEKLVDVKADDKPHREWQRVLRYVPSHLHVTRSITTGNHELSFEIGLGGKSKPWAIALPSGMLGNQHKLSEAMALAGAALKGKEPKEFVDLMASWLQKLQLARRVADVTEHLGWITDEKNDLVGFSAGPATFYSDGRISNDVRAAPEFHNIAIHYKPRGALPPWQTVAKFLAEQDNPAFTTILASAFAAPLLKFTGLPGGILAIVSSASGVGKSSALKTAQAVWGSPTHGINAVNDTSKSVARKLGFLNNLPAFWDELRGHKTIEDFLSLAFQMTQGKERSRLDSAAQLRESATWETMLVVAANDSIFEAMGRGTVGTDAGIVRTFEIFVEPFVTTRNRADIALMFDQLNNNYGYAGRLYAEYIAQNQKDVAARVELVFQTLSVKFGMEAQERFWFAIMASLIVGAELAAKLDLVKINLRTLSKFLVESLVRLRVRSGVARNANDPAEMVAAFMQQYQDRALIVETFPKKYQPSTTYIPTLVGGAPKADKIAYHVSQQEQLMRVPVIDFERWLTSREQSPDSVIRRMQNDKLAKKVRFMLGMGTKYETVQQHCLEINLNLLNARSADSLHLDDSPDSSPPSAP